MPLNGLLMASNCFLPPTFTYITLKNKKKLTRRPLASSYQAVWSGGDGPDAAKWCDNASVTSAVVSDGIVNMEICFMLDCGVFVGCYNLRAVRLPESLRKIGESAFQGCSALVHVDIPSGVNEFGEGAFHSCSSLETVTIPEGVVHLPDSIFNECESLKSVKLPTSLEVIGWDAFNFCRSLATVNFHDLKGLKTIFGYA